MRAGEGGLVDRALCLVDWSIYRWESVYESDERQGVYMHKRIIRR